MEAWEDAGWTMSARRTMDRDHDRLVRLEQSVLERLGSDSWLASNFMSLLEP
jgi:hypothetical protein